MTAVGRKRFDTLVIPGCNNPSTTGPPLIFLKPMKDGLGREYTNKSEDIETFNNNYAAALRPGNEYSITMAPTTHNVDLSAKCHRYWCNAALGRVCGKSCQDKIKFASRKRIASQVLAEPLKGEGTHAAFKAAVEPNLHKADMRESVYHGLEHTFEQAQSACAAAGARLCTPDELIVQSRVTVNGKREAIVPATYLNSDFFPIWVDTASKEGHQHLQRASVFKNWLLASAELDFTAYASLDFKVDWEDWYNGRTNELLSLPQYTSSDAKHFNIYKPALVTSTDPNHKLKGPIRCCMDAMTDNRQFYPAYETQKVRQAPKTSSFGQTDFTSAVVAPKADGCETADFGTATNICNGFGASLCTKDEVDAQRLNFSNFMKAIDAMACDYATINDQKIWIENSGRYQWYQPSTGELGASFTSSRPPPAEKHVVSCCYRAQRTRTPMMCVKDSLNGNFHPQQIPDTTGMNDDEAKKANGEPFACAEWQVLNLESSDQRLKGYNELQKRIDVHIPDPHAHKDKRHGTLIKLDTLDGSKCFSPNRPLSFQTKEECIEFLSQRFGKKEYDARSTCQLESAAVVENVHEVRRMCSSTGSPMAQYCPELCSEAQMSNLYQFYPNPNYLQGTAASQSLIDEMDDLFPETAFAGRKFSFFDTDKVCCDTLVTGGKTAMADALKKHRGICGPSNTALFRKDMSRKYVWR